MKYKEKSQLHLDCKDAKVKAFQVRWDLRIVQENRTMIKIFPEALSFFERKCKIEKVLNSEKINTKRTITVI